MAEETNPKNQRWDEWEKYIALYLMMIDNACRRAAWKTCYMSPRGIRMNMLSGGHRSQSWKWLVRDNGASTEKYALPVADECGPPRGAVNGWRTWANVKQLFRATPSKKQHLWVQVSGAYVAVDSELFQTFARCGGGSKWRCRTSRKNVIRRTMYWESVLKALYSVRDDYV